MSYEINILQLVILLVTTGVISYLIGKGVGYRTGYPEGLNNGSKVMLEVLNEQIVVPALEADGTYEEAADRIAREVVAVINRSTKRREA